jgi:hypothetical protein
VSRQFSSLVRHFFGRFFDNEFVAANADPYATVVKILALLATPGFCLPWFRYVVYLRLDHYPSQARLPVLWYDRCFFLSFAVLVMGGVTVLEWDALFPDRRDYVSLIPLPIRARTMFLAKVGALALFLVGFTAAVNLPSTLMFPLFSFRSVDGNIGGIAGTIAAQGISVFAASAFVFLSMVALEGMLLNVLSVKWFRKASVYVQCAMVFALLSMFFVFPNFGGKIYIFKSVNPAMLFAYPPAWFLGLNEVLLGSRDAVFLQLTRVALGALASSAFIAAIAYGVAYRRHVKRTLEAIEGADGVRTRIDAWISAAADRLSRNAVERGTIAFIGKTVARSPKHRIFLAAYIGVGCAFVLQGLLESGARDTWLSVPLVLCFFALSGLRYIFTIPSELPANWIFRVTESDARRNALDGARRAMLWLAVVPLFAGLTPFFFVLWTPGVALAHLVFSVVISILLIEALTLDFWKIPFTCSYPPGKANVTILWIVYWLAFTTYAYSMARLEGWMVLRPSRLVIFYAAAAAVWIGFALHRRRWERTGYVLVFEDAPEPVVRQLGLSEIAWLSSKK